MKRLFLIFLSFPLLATAQATNKSVTNIGTTNEVLVLTNTTVTIVVPSTGATNTVTANVFIATPISTTESYPFIMQLRTNQSFAIQDERGNNLFGLRHDAYGPGTGRHWEINFGSKQQGLIDQLFDIGHGGDIGWRINGDLSQCFWFNASSSAGIEFRYANTNYLPDAPQLMLFNSYGEVHVTSLFGEMIRSGQLASVGSAAGTGGSVGVTIDDSASDLSVQVSLVTGHQDLGSGALFTYTLENAGVPLHPTLVNEVIKPVFSAANASAAKASGLVYVTATGTNFTMKSASALIADTTYIWNFFICR